MIERIPKDVLIDMDGVSSNLDKKFFTRLSELCPELPSITDRKNFHIHKEYPPQYKKIINEILQEPGFYDSLDLIEGALEGWEKIIKLGYNPRFCSSPNSGSSTCIAEKIMWIRKNYVPVFGEDTIIKAIIDKDKYAYYGLALIDDHPNIKKSEEAIWQQILFDKSYNQDTDLPRLYGWNDDNLGLLLEEAQKEYYDRSRKLGKISLKY